MVPTKVEPRTPQSHGGHTKIGSPRASITIECTANIAWDTVVSSVPIQTGRESSLLKRLLVPLLLACLVSACARGSGHRPTLGASPAATTATPAASTSATPPAITPRVLSDKRYDEVVFAATHNSYNHAGAFLFPNQDHSITRQLEDGVRALMIDVHPYSGIDPRQRGRPWVFHSSWLLGSQSLESVLAEVKTFLDGHPLAVTTLILESYISVDAMAPAFRNSGLDRYFHVQPAGAPWPTLGAMVSQDTRLVVLNDERDTTGNHPWSHYVWDLAVETAFTAHTLADLDSRLNRGHAGNDLFIVNHFLTTSTLGTGDRDLSDAANAAAFLGTRLQSAWTDTGKIPNFVVVDFHDRGDLLGVVAGLNQQVP